MTQKMILNFPAGISGTPITYELIRVHDVKVNILKAEIQPGQIGSLLVELEGDQEKARQIQLSATPLIDALFSEVNPIPVKAAMNMMGMQAGPLRGPLCEMEDAHREVLRQEMVRFGLLK